MADDFSAPTYGAVTNLLARQTPRQFGRKIGFIGDSFTNGAVATVPSFWFSNRIPQILGTASVTGSGDGLVISGHPSKTSVDIYPFLAKDIIAAGCDTVFLQAGTNDAGLLVSFLTFAKTMAKMMHDMRAAGIKFYVWTIPPRYNGGGGVTVRLAIDIMNYWLRQFVPQYGTLIDVYHFVLDPSTGYMSANYAASDAALAGGYSAASDTTHFSNVGAEAVANEMVRVVKSSSPFQSVNRMVDGFSTFNFVTNPWFLSGTAGWTLQPASINPGSISTVSDTTGLIEIGSFFEMNVGTTSASDTIYVQSIPIGLGKFAPGDVVSISAKMQVADISGDWLTQHVQHGGTIYGEVFVINTANGQTIAQIGFQNFGTAVGGGIYNFGPGLKTFTIPTGSTGIQIWIRGKAAANKNYKYRFGEIGLFNLTTSNIVNAPTSF